MQLRASPPFVYRVVADAQNDTRRSGILGTQCFARGFAHDIEALRNVVLESWSNGQIEGQINRIKTLKRTMYGRAGIDLFRARLLPLQG